MAILMQNVQFKIIDHSVRVPPMLFNIPLLAMSRNKENKWIIETTSPVYSSLDNLLRHHLKLFERNLIYDTIYLIKEQDRLRNRLNQNRLESYGDEEDAEILDQVLNQKESLLKEIQLLREENERLRKIVKDS
ncbi:hypothetical protein SSS_06334 [Sarcoptes scabiei]|nr:hypothetical protein SSS_06334 [Sarcoptes scabiei]